MSTNAVKAKATKIALWITACYAVISLGISAWNYASVDSKPVHYVATRPLPCNHRIVEADLATPRGVNGTARAQQLPPRTTLTGKYTRAAIAANQYIVASTLRTDPVIARQDDGRTVVPVALPAALPAGLVDAGTYVDVVSSGAIIAPRVRILAVTCTSAGPCAALVRVRPEVAAAIDEKAIVAIRTDAGGDVMDQKGWIKVGETVEIPAKPAAIWTKVLDYVPLNTVLKLEATEKWEYADGVKCGPDGAVANKLKLDPLSNVAPIGALIGRIGGSTATIPKGDESGIFAVGSFAVVSVPAAGPLFLTINLAPSQYPTTTDTIKVTIYESKP
ncbi:MAG TPA: hypothetical protein VFN10_19520 [Thermoanaerobaculia bacterium]|nr:hypothetical protein [Thermoanaerobaculia bacterium]